MLEISNYKNFVATTLSQITKQQNNKTTHNNIHNGNKMFVFEKR